jgi:hypothetical protein
MIKVKYYIRGADGDIVVGFDSGNVNKGVPHMLVGEREYLLTETSGKVDVVELRKEYKSCME